MGLGDGELADPAAFSAALRFAGPALCGGRPCQCAFCHDCVRQAIQRMAQCPPCQAVAHPGGPQPQPHPAIQSLLDETMVVRSEPPCSWIGHQDAASEEACGTSMVQVFVRGLTGRTLALDVSLCDSVDALRARLECVTSVPADLFYLTHQGRVMRGGCLLSDCRVSKHATLAMRARPAGRARTGVWVSLEGGGLLALPGCCAADTIEKVRATLMPLLGLPLGVSQEDLLLSPAQQSQGWLLADKRCVGSVPGFRPSEDPRERAFFLHLSCERKVSTTSLPPLPRPLSSERAGTRRKRARATVWPICGPAKRVRRQGCV